LPPSRTTIQIAARPTVTEMCELQFTTEVPVSLALTSARLGTFSASADDLYEALILIRVELEKHAYRVLCNGARPNAWPSAMARQMGAARKVYLLQPYPVQVSMKDLVDIFAPAPYSEVVTVREQRAALENLQANPPAPTELPSPITLQERARGCMMGQLVGDALGSIVEFERARTIRAAYPTGLRGMIPSPVHHTLAGQPTDDSELALALARCLIDRGAFEAEVVAGAYADWYASDPFDCGATTAQALGAMVKARARDASLAQAGYAHANAASEANGALMRQSPLAIFGWQHDPDTLDVMVRADTCLTHPNQVCQDASAAFIIALAATMRDGLDGPAASALAHVWSRTHGQSPAVTQAIAAARTMPPHYEGSQGHVLIALQNAFYQALHAPSFEEGIVDTVMRGGDTDTNAAIAGALLGAIHGIEAIPADWRTTVLGCRPEAGLPEVYTPRPSVYWPTDALDLADRLLHGKHP
jgi:ADP-ribosyl-[dinitrogen reductase] hydrolase